MTIPIVLGMLVSLLVALSVQSKLHELSEMTYRAAAQRNATLVESLVGLETVKALGIEGRMQGRWEQSVSFLAQVSTRLRLLSATTLNTSMWVSQSVNVVVIIVGVYLLAEKQMTLGGLIACSMLSSRAMAPITQVAGLMTQYHHATTAFSSLEQILSNPVERPDDSSFLTRQNLQGKVEFKSVTFGYPEQVSSVLDDISFAINAGEKVAVLGRVGSGKSTLLKLILGLYQPRNGAIFIDGIDQRQLDPAELKCAFGYVSQDSTLFYGTLRDNITLGMPAADDAAIIRAARAGALTDFVNSHPQGFDMLVGERGDSLSGGQRQGVSIARAVIKDPSVILLDEPTGAMDHQSEEQVKQEFRQFADGKTVLLVTHRTALLEMVDRILVLDGGKLVADGPRDTVIEALRSGKIGRAS